MADVFDDYAHAPMQRIVADALRGKDERDGRGVAEQRMPLDRRHAWTDRWRRGREWAACGRFTLADCAAAPALFYADWVHPVQDGLEALRRYRARLLARRSVARVVDGARPWRKFFPLGAPERD